MAKGILIIVCFFVVAGCLAQPVNYRDPVFAKVKVEHNRYYGETAVNGRGKAYLFDLYRPEGDSMARPLIIWIHGGGFRFGSKRAKGIRIWCMEFARRGYVCAAINYRMRQSQTLFRFTRLVAGCADAVEDTREAVYYFKQHAGVLGIDTTRIVLAGNSAGGMVALQAAYSLPWELRRLAGDSFPRERIEAGPVVGIWTESVLRENNVAAVINFWGAIFDTRWLRNARVPIVNVFGTKDRIVIPGRRNLFAGGEAIHESADSLGIPNTVKPFKGFSHELQRPFNPLFSGSGAHRRWKEAGQFAADFLAGLWLRRLGPR